jgi:hypothetical protein
MQRQLSPASLRALRGFVAWAQIRPLLENTGHGGSDHPTRFNSLPGTKMTFLTSPVRNFEID